MVKERLEAGEQEHQSGVEVALPKRGIFVPHETQKETGKDNSDFWYQTLDSPSEALAVACFIYMMSSEFHSVGVIFFFFFLAVICYYLTLPLQTVNRHCCGYRGCTAAPGQRPDYPHTWPEDPLLCSDNISLLCLLGCGLRSSQIFLLMTLWP